MMKNWYDSIAQLYDIFTIHFYKKMRQELLEHLDLQKGNRILIIACGTGQSFEMLEKKIGEKGQLIAIDYSEGMLKEAQKRIERHKWSNIQLIQADATKIDKHFFEARKIDVDFDVVLAELAFSVIPEWKKVMNVSRDLLKSGGKLALLDWYRPQNDLLTKVVDFLADAETTRKTSQYAKELTRNFQVVKKYFGGNIYIAIGVK